MADVLLLVTSNWRESSAVAKFVRRLPPKSRLLLRSVSNPQETLVRAAASQSAVPVLFAPTKQSRAFEIQERVDLVKLADRVVMFQGAGEHPDLEHIRLLAERHQKPVQNFREVR